MFVLVLGNGAAHSLSFDEMQTTADETVKPAVQRQKAVPQSPAELDYSCPDGTQELQGSFDVMLEQKRPNVSPWRRHFVYDGCAQETGRVMYFYHAYDEGKDRDKDGRYKVVIITKKGAIESNVLFKRGALTIADFLNVPNKELSGASSDGASFNPIHFYDLGDVQFRDGGEMLRGRLRIAASHLSLLPQVGEPPPEVALILPLREGKTITLVLECASMVGSAGECKGFNGTEQYKARFELVDIHDEEFTPNSINQPDQYSRVTVTQGPKTIFESTPVKGGKSAVFDGLRLGLGARVAVPGELSDGKSGQVLIQILR